MLTHCSIRARAFSAPVIGDAKVAQSFVEVRWAWMSYLLSLLLLSFIFLTSTIYKTRVSQVNILKSSQLALMYGSTDKSRAGLHHADEREMMQQKAAKSNVMLVRAQGGWRLE